MQAAIQLFILLLQAAQIDIAQLERQMSFSAVLMELGNTRI